MKTWLMLVYRIPREPSAGRVYAWRKLKQLGAVLLHDSVWVLPATARTQEQFQWLASEIVEFGGEATVWKSECLFAREEVDLVRKFETEADDLFRDILKALKAKRPDLQALSRKYQQALDRDYFRSKLGPQAREALLGKKAEGKGLEDGP